MQATNVLNDAYRAVMDPTVNPLSALPPGQRFQTMIYLSILWTLIFCLGTGAWVWYGELMVLHVLVALGILMTDITFRRARTRLR